MKFIRLMDFCYIIWSVNLTKWWKRYRKKMCNWQLKWRNHGIVDREEWIVSVPKKLVLTKKAWIKALRVWSRMTKQGIKAWGSILSIRNSKLSRLAQVKRMQVKLTVCSRSFQRSMLKMIRLLLNEKKCQREKRRKPGLFWINRLLIKKVHLESRVNPEKTVYNRTVQFLSRQVQ